MNIKENDGYNLIYAKRMGSPKNMHLNTRMEVIEFFIENLNNIDFLSINDVIINKNQLINESKGLSRYLKLKKINDSI